MSVYRNSTLTEDEVLVKGIMDGDESIITKFYNDNHRYILCLCQKYLKNWEDSEDMAQDCFITILKNVGKFKFKSKFSTWMYTIICNNCLMKLRKDRTKEKKHTPIDMELFGDDNVKDEIIKEIPDERNPLVGDLTIDIEKVINCLPNGYKQTLVNHDFLGLEHEEVAKIMGVSVGTSKSQLHKARTKFKKLFDKRSNPKVFIPNN